MGPPGFSDSRRSLVYYDDHGKIRAFKHYDLRYILERDWRTLGPKLVGKMHITMGTRDDNHLHNAVRLMEDLLKNTNNPYYAVDVEYGPHQPHCFTGDPREDLLVGARFAQSGGKDGKVCSSRRGYEELGILNDTPVLPG